MPKLKERMAEAEKNKSANVEKQVQRILAGEPLERSEGKRQGGPGEGKKKKGPSSTVE